MRCAAQRFLEDSIVDALVNGLLKAGYSATIDLGKLNEEDELSPHRCSSQVGTYISWLLSFSELKNHYLHGLSSDEGSRHL